MIVIKVVWTDWNGEERESFISSECCEGVRKAPTEEDALMVAIQYVKRRWTECAHIDSVEFIAR